MTVKELTKKMNDALASQEERHRIELKKAVDKQVASEKMKKDRWVDLKTKKIKVRISKTENVWKKLGKFFRGGEMIFLRFGKKLKDFNIN